MIPAVVIILAFFPSKFLTFQKEVKRIETMIESPRLQNLFSKIILNFKTFESDRVEIPKNTKIDIKQTFLKKMARKINFQIWN